MTCQLLECVFDGVRVTSNEADGKCISFVSSDLLPGQTRYDIYENRCSKIRVCSMVARIRSFHVNNKPVGFILANAPSLL